MSLYMVIKTPGSSNFMPHGVDIAKTLLLNGQHLPLHWKAKSKSLKSMPLKINNLHQDSASEDTHRLSSLSQDKRMTQVLSTTKVAEVKAPWPNGQENKSQTWKSLITFNLPLKAYTMNIAKAETCVSLTFCPVLWMQPQSKDKATWTQLRKLAWDSKENHSNSCGPREEINLSWKKSLAYQASDTLQSSQSLRQSKCMVDSKDHSANKTFKTSWMKSWRTRPSSQNFLHFQPLRPLQKSKVMLLKKKDAMSTNAQDLQILKNKVVLIKICDFCHFNSFNNHSLKINRSKIQKFKIHLNYFVYI